jgi:hypothetical protein
LEKMVRLFENFDRLWGRLPGPPPAIRPPSSSAPLESGQGSMQVHTPPASPAPSESTESDWDPESLVWHPPTPSTVLSTESDLEHGSTSTSESASDLDHESKDVDHDAPPPSPGSSIEPGHSHTPPSGPGSSTDSEHWYTPPSSTGSAGSDSDSDRWSTISNAPSAESLLENLQTADSELKGKARISRRITGIARGAVNEAQSEFSYSTFNPVA